MCSCPDIWCADSMTANLWDEYKHKQRTEFVILTVRMQCTPNAACSAIMAGASAERQSAAVAILKAERSCCNSQGSSGRGGSTAAMRLKHRKGPLTSPKAVYLSPNSLAWRAANSSSVGSCTKGLALFLLPPSLLLRLADFARASAAYLASRSSRNPARRALFC